MISSSQLHASDELLDRLCTLIAERIGIRTTDYDRSALAAAVDERSRALGMAGPWEYLRMLGNDASGTEEEWRRIVLRITNGESYFFRDHGQIALLRETILPELIRRRAEERTLRIWSAGCSTGEEPYSLAILLAELLPDLHRWNIMLLGTDINPEFLERARHARFNQWSFRMVEPGLHARYFHERDGLWELDAMLRSLVRFERWNLLRDGTPTRQIGGQGFDLIVCRNVFIYFDRTAVATVLHGFTGALAGDGYLMTGHSELTGIPIDGLQTLRYPGSLVYQRQIQPHAMPVAVNRSERLAAAADKPQPGISVTADLFSGASSAVPVAGVVSKSPAAGPADGADICIRDVEASLRDGDYAEVIRRGEPLVRQFPHHAALRSCLALAYANRGEYGLAEMHCRAALEASSFEVVPYHILAQIAEERGDRAEARGLLRTVLYLAPSSVAAYLHLADLYDAENDKGRARNARISALDILRSTKSTAVVPMLEEFTVAELSEHLRALLGDQHSSNQP